MEERPGPTHDLAAVQKSVRVGFLHYRRGALDDAAEMEMDRHDIDACVLALTPADFHKTMPAKNPKWLGCMQDVYKPVFRGKHIYVKFQRFPGKRVHIVSFKEKDKE